MADQPILGITRIPQTVNLKLENGTLTLKAGSSAYMPNGVGVFTKCTSTSDLTYTPTWGAGYKCYVTGYVNSSGVLAGIGMCRSDVQFSGSTQPSATINGTMWYDTSANKIKTYRNGTWTADSVSESRVLFLAKIDVGVGNVITNIDQVFNGFGYIGSSIFVLPDVEGYYPDGKDGFTKKYKTIKTNNVLVYTNTSSSSNIPIAFSTTANKWGAGFEVVEKLPDVSQMVTWKIYYSKEDNKMYYTSNGSSITQRKDVAFGYFSSASSSPYAISSLDIVNPFLSINVYDVSEYSKYLSNLLIIQYNGKPKASQTIQSLGQMFPTDLILDVINGFDLNTAKGKQLDILAKYIGVDRGYTNSNSQAALLTDEEFSLLMKLKIIVNTGSATLYGLETSLYNFFGNGIQVVDNVDLNGKHTMSLSYFIRSDWSNVGLAAIQQDCLPHPTGVSVSYSTFTTDPYFGFVTYENQAHPLSTGFRDYSTPTKAGQMYTYDKQI